MKIKNFTAGLLTVLVAGNISLCNISSVYGEEVYKQGSIIEVKEDEGIFHEYIVKPGDNASIISKIITRYYGEVPDSKYWTVVAFINNYPRVIQPGDVIYFPKTFEQLLKIYDKLVETGWIKKYVRENNIYKRKIQVSMTELMGLLHEIYGDDVCIDPDFMLNYLRTIEKDDEIKIGENGEIDNETLFKLTDWIPTLEELNTEKSEKTSK